MTDLEEAQQSYDQCLTRHNSLLCRIVGVTDRLLRESLHDEYIHVAESLARSKELLERLTVECKLQMIAQWRQEYERFYAGQFIKAKDDEPLMSNIKNKWDIELIAKQLRIRIPTKLSQRRELLILLNAAKRQLKLIDYEGLTFEIIGTFPDLNPMILRLSGFSKINDEPGYICMDKL